MNNKGGRAGTLGKLFSLPLLYIHLQKNLRKQRKFIRKELHPELLPFQNSNDGSITAADIKKITSYYALGVPVILGKAFKILTGKNFTKQERYCITFLGGISGLLDDLFDNPRKEVNHLKEFIHAPENLVPGNSYEALLVHLYLAGLSKAKNAMRLKEQAGKVYEAQQKSLIQKRKISPVDLKQITFSKGGSSFVFYRLCLEDPLEEAEEKLVYHLGGLMQLGNDIFDLWEDVQANTSTVATTSTDITKLRNLFSEELNRTYILAGNIDYPQKQVDHFLNLIKLGLSRVFVCLDQFEKLQLQIGGAFQPENYERKQLICDMQKASNQLKAMNYYLSL